MLIWKPKKDVPYLVYYFILFIYSRILYLLLLLSLSLLSRNFLYHYPICIFVGKRLNEERVDGETYSRPSSRCVCSKRKRTKSRSSMEHLFYRYVILSSLCSPFGFLLHIPEFCCCFFILPMRCTFTFIIFFFPIWNFWLKRNSKLIHVMLKLILLILLI